jgi:GNAT superfamily N-acetyltransferase
MGLRLGLLDRLSKTRKSGSMNQTLMAPVLHTHETLLAAGVTAAGGYVVRPAGPQDAERVRDFITALSVETQYLRFFTVVSPPSGGLLRALAGGSRADILIITDDCGAVTGHGMAVDADHPDGIRADIGLVIADRWQGQGLGTVLLRLLVERAAGRGVTALQLEVLPGNSRMLGIIERHWPDALRVRTPDAISITAPLAPPLAIPPAGIQQIANLGGSRAPDRSAA